MKILEADNLCKNYGKGSTLVKAIDNVSFTVDEGDFVAIVGSSGSGKENFITTLILFPISLNILDKESAPGGMLNIDDITPPVNFLTVV